MLGRLLLLFIAVPAVELGLLIEIGARIGTLATLGLIVVTGAVGATLARQQGLRAFQSVQQELADGRMPAGPLVDGLMILIAGALLMTPGLLTDAFGFSLLIPRCRAFFRREVLARFQRAVAEGRVHVRGGVHAEFSDAPVDVEYGAGADPDQVRPRSAAAVPPKGHEPPRETPSDAARDAGRKPDDV